MPNGIKVYKGEFIAWQPYIMGRDETIWGDDAKQFDPDRFMNSEDGLKPSQFKFNAFNMGPRLWYVVFFLFYLLFVSNVDYLNDLNHDVVWGNNLPRSKPLHLPLLFFIITNLNYYQDKGIPQIIYPPSLFP